MVAVRADKMLGTMRSVQRHSASAVMSHVLSRGGSPGTMDSRRFDADPIGINPVHRQWTIVDGPRSVSRSEEFPQLALPRYPPSHPAPREGSPYFNGHFR